VTKAILISLVAGGLATSLFEYLLKYNLIDLVVDKIKGLFKTAESDVEAVFDKARKK